MAGIKLKRGAVLMLVLSIGSIAMLAVSASSVFAGFEWRDVPPAPAAAPPSGGVEWGNDTSSPAPPAKQEPSTKTVQVQAEKITAPVKEEILEGFGTDLPLTIALKQVIPPEYQVSLGTGVKPDIYVSWTGGKPWQGVLTGMLMPHGLGYEIQDKKVFINNLSIRGQQPQPATDVREQKPVPAPAVAWAPPPAVAPEPALALVPAPAPAPASTKAPACPEAGKRPTWHAAKGQTLKEILSVWSKKAGVELYWMIDYDYRMNEDVSFEGPFSVAADGLLSKLSESRPQPYGELYQGKDGSSKVLLVSSYDLTH